MIKIKNTPNLAGVVISGDYDDLENLVTAFHLITINEYSENHSDCIDISTRVLGLCYDIRHAYQGDREVELVDNHMTVTLMKHHGIIVPTQNVYYSCKYLYPEMVFVMLSLNELVLRRMIDLTKGSYLFKDPLDKRYVWDQTIATIRQFQSEFNICVKETLSEAAFARWISFMNRGHIEIENIAGQFIDVLNIKYIKMSKEKRLKSLSSMAKRIAEFRSDQEHEEIWNVVMAAAQEYQCDPGEIRLHRVDYPESFAW